MIVPSARLGWICMRRSRYQSPMNRKQRRAGARLSGQGRGGTKPAAPLAAWFNTAVGHHRAGRMAEAERVCRNLLSIDPGNAPTLHLLGLVEHQSGRSDDAIEHVRLAIARDGRDPAFHHNLGNILRAEGPLAEALACYERALALAPSSVDTLYNLGNTCQDLGRAEQAVAYFERALRFNPEAIELYNNLGTALQDLGRLDKAIACYRKGLALRPEVVETLLNLAGALRAQGDLDGAQHCYERALALRPDHVESHVGLAVVLRDRGQLEEAAAENEWALALAPDHAETHSNLGIVLADLGRAQEAIAHCERALALQPEGAELHYNLGSVLQRQGRYAEALASYERALTLRPDYAQAHFNRGLALLLTGRLEEGWPEYEWRFTVARYDRKFDPPLWSGEPLEGRSILIYAEQGLGDTLQFIRYVPAVAERGGKVVLEVPPALVRLARTVAGASQVVAAGDPLPAFACHCPLLSLPRVFKTELTTIPNRVPYLAPPAEASAVWAERIATASDPLPTPGTPALAGGRPGAHPLAGKARVGAGLRVGIVWAGNIVGAIDLRLLQPLWDVAGISWFSLQVGDHSGDISLLDKFEISDLSPWLTDFAETAAAVCQLDLVISVDTSVAHLAGALGRQVWLMVPRWPDWRWLLDRDDSPWYPTARLFRQKEVGDWPGVAREVAAALTHHSESSP
jgi:tetratricopeptide (TPR) repeat protein